MVQPLQNRAGAFDQCIGTPRSWPIIRAQVAKKRDQDAHAGAPCGDDIAFRIPDVDALTGGARQQLGAEQQRVGVRLAPNERISGDDATRTGQNAESFKEGPCKPPGFVGHYAPGDRLLVKAGQNFLHARE